MKLKRLLSIVLSLILVFGTVSGLSFAAEEAEEVYGGDSLGLLAALELAEFSEKELGENIARADFLKLIGTAAGYGETKSTEAVFADLPLEDKREPYIKALYNMGVIDLGADNKIFPDGEIGLMEAVAVAVKVTGYGLVAEARGGYPNGYYHVAKNNELLKGLPTSQYTVLTKGMAAKLVENTLKANLMVQTGFGSDITFEERKEASLLATLYNVYYLDDVVNGVDVSRIAGENDVDAFYALIGRTELDAMFIENIHDLLGYRVNAYYKVEKGDIPRLIYIEKNSKNNETVLNIDDISTVSSGKIKAYDESSKLKTYSFKRTLPVIYNTVATKQAFTLALISGKQGKVTLLDNTGDKKADVILVDAYENYVVAHVDKNENMIYDKYDKTKTLVLDAESDDPYTNIYDAKGNLSTAGAINEGDVVSVFESANDAYQKYINAYVINKTISGVIERTLDNGKKLVIGGVEYKISDACKAKFGTVNTADPSISNILKAGQSVKLYLDYNGIAVYAEKNAATEFAYGFVVASSINGGLDADFQLKLYTTNAQFEIYDVANKIQIDGRKFNKSDVDDIIAKLNLASNKMFGVLIPDGCISSLVKFALNAEGQIAYIDTILNDETGTTAVREDNADAFDALFSIAGNSVMYRSPERLGHQIICAAKTPVLGFPDPSAKDTTTGEYLYDVNNEDYYFVSVCSSEFVTEKKYNVKAFYSDNKQFTAELIGLLYGSRFDLSYTDNMGVITQEVGEMYDEATGEIVDYIVVNGATNVFVDKDFSLIHLHC